MRLSVNFLYSILSTELPPPPPQDLLTHWKQFKEANSPPSLLIFEMWEETQVPWGNPHYQNENMQQVRIESGLLEQRGSMLATVFEKVNYILLKRTLLWMCILYVQNKKKYCRCCKPEIKQVLRKEKQLTLQVQDPSSELNIQAWNINYTSPSTDTTWPRVFPVLLCILELE